MSTPAFFRITDTAQKANVSRSTIWLWVRQGRFPAPVKLGPRVTAWRAEDVAKWIENPTGWQTDSEVAQ